MSLMVVCEPSTADEIELMVVTNSATVVGGVMVMIDPATADWGIYGGE